jgi:double-stranded uracil-DNA glycosylase
MILLDYLAPGLRLVVCGTAPGRASAARGHYYAGPGNRFWEYLHLAGLTPVRLRPEDDATIPSYGIGLTDVAKHAIGTDSQVGAGADDPATFITKVEQYRPAWVAFHGKASATSVWRHLGRHGVPRYGLQPLAIGGAQVFVLPSASAANQRRDYEGKPDRLVWFQELARLAGFVCEAEASPNL